MTSLPASPPLARSLAERNYNALTPVQMAVLGDATVGRDLLVSAQTGSGKTVAYGLAVASELLGSDERFAKAAAPLALIVAPTRELALQVRRELAWLYQFTGARVVSCVGGMDPHREQRELEAGAHIVVGTPGRLCDHLRRGRLNVSELKAIVLDEADEMLDLGFREDLEFILETTPAARRTLLFSATLPRGIVTLAKQYQKDALRLEVAGGEGGHADIEYRAMRVAAPDVEHAVVNVLRYFESPGAIVFCNTRHAVRHLQATLLERGFTAVALSGELSQNERTQALQALRDGRARVCVATDVAARGIDLPNLGLVIHAELPNDADVMQHRSGRTGRAGKKGVSVLLVPPARRRRVEFLLRDSGIDAEWGAVPAADDIRVLDQQRMLQDAIFTEEPGEDDHSLAQVLLAERTPEEIATALARLYRARLPAPEDVRDPGEGRDGRNARRDNRDTGPQSKPEKARRRESMPEGSVWFRANVGRKKNAEARWLLPMICRRGGVDKQAIGAIRIYPTSTEFEISAQAADQFAANISRPDKEEHIRIEALPDGPQGRSPSDAPARQDQHGAPPYHKPRRDRGPTRPRNCAGLPAGDERSRSEKPRFGKKPGFGKKHRRDDKPARRDDSASSSKPAFGAKGKTKKKHKHRD